MNEIDAWIENNLFEDPLFDDVIETEDDLTDSLVITKEYLSKEDWCNYIHKSVSENKIGYMEAIIDYCEANGIEVETASKLVDETIKELIRLEAEENNMMRPIGRLEF